MKGARPGLTVPDWESPATLGINKRASHAPLRSFRDIKSAVSIFRPGVVGTCPTQLQPSEQLRSQRAAATQSLAARGVAPLPGTGIRTLSGCEWSFQLFRNPGEVPEDFVQPGFAAEGWHKVGMWGRGGLQGSCVSWRVSCCACQWKDRDVGASQLQSPQLVALHAILQPTSSRQQPNRKASRTPAFVPWPPDRPHPTSRSRCR